MAIVVSSRWLVRDGEQEAVWHAVEALVDETRREPGVLLLQPHRDPSEPRAVYFYEQFVDEDALEAHTRTAHFERYVLGICLPRLESRERGTYVTWEP